jgi:thiamine-phosphate pyrophosphorylase
MNPQLLFGLYAITPADYPIAQLLTQVTAAIHGGARLIQYRAKRASPAERHATAAALLALCRAAHIPLIINDDVALAAAIGADGVHLGRDDSDPRSARAQLGATALIGVSCYNELARATAAAQAGANYLAFGSFFASPTKPAAVRAAPELLTAAQKLGLPLVAIGGITPHNGAVLRAAGAQMLAVVTGVFDQPDITAAARAYTSLFSQENSA